MAGLCLADGRFHGQRRHWSFCFTSRRVPPPPGQLVRDVPGTPTDPFRLPAPEAAGPETHGIHSTQHRSHVRGRRRLQTRVPGGVGLLMVGVSLACPSGLRSRGNSVPDTIAATGGRW